jgi:hypothetical protein
MSLAVTSLARIAHKSEKGSLTARANAVSTCLALIRAAISQVLDIGIEKLLEGPQARSSLAGTFLAGCDLFTARQLSLYVARGSLDTHELGELRPSFLELHPAVTRALLEPSDPEESIPLAPTGTGNRTPSGHWDALGQFRTGSGALLEDDGPHCRSAH